MDSCFFRLRCSDPHPRSGLIRCRCYYFTCNIGKSERSIVEKIGLVLLTNDTLYEMEESSDLGNTYNLLSAYLKSHQCTPIYFISMFLDPIGIDITL